jgi:hypothetical protein
MKMVRIVKALEIQRIDLKTKLEVPWKTKETEKKMLEPGLKIPFEFKNQTTLVWSLNLRWAPCFSIWKEEANKTHQDTNDKQHTQQNCKLISTHISWHEN